MRGVICQLDSQWEDKQANFERVREMLAAEPPEAGALLVLPEMFATGFSMEAAKIAEGPGGARPTDTFLASIARDYGIWTVGGMAALGPDGKPRNQSALLDPEGREVARYSKIRPFCFGEKDCYAPGEATVVARCGEFDTALFICYDLRFPELFRSAARRGAQLFVVIANWPIARIHHWTTLLQARAIENQAYVIGVNRVGTDPTLTYTGRSMVVAPGGEVLLDAGSEEGLFGCDIALDPLLTYRRKLPFLADLHPAYVRDDAAPGPQSV